MKPLAQAFAELLDDGGLDEKPAVDVPQRRIQLSAAQGKVGIDSMTQDEFDKATTLMDSLYKMSARRENLYVVNDGAKLKDVVDELCEHMDVVPELKKTPVDRNTIPDKVVRQVRERLWDTRHACHDHATHGRVRRCIGPWQDRTSNKMAV